MPMRVPVMSVTGASIRPPGEESTGLHPLDRVVRQRADRAIRAVLLGHGARIGQAHAGAEPFLDSLLDRHYEGDERHRIQKALAAEQGRGGIELRGSLQPLRVPELVDVADDELDELLPNFLPRFQLNVWFQSRIPPRALRSVFFFVCSPRYRKRGPLE